MKVCTGIVLLKATRIHEESFRNMTYDVTMTSLLKTLGKLELERPRNQAHYISIKR